MDDPLYKLYLDDNGIWHSEFLGDSRSAVDQCIRVLNDFIQDSIRAGHPKDQSIPILWDYRNKIFPPFHYLFFQLRASVPRSPYHYRIVYLFASTLKMQEMQLYLKEMPESSNARKFYTAEQYQEAVAWLLADDDT